jgi:hypothetical protein
MKKNKYFGNKNGVGNSGNPLGHPIPDEKKRTHHIYGGFTRAEWANLEAWASDGGYSGKHKVIDWLRNLPQLEKGETS